MERGRSSEEEFERKLEFEIKSRFKTSLMSNSKWKRLIENIIENSSLFQRIEFKKIIDDRIGHLFIDENTKYKLDYWDFGFEGLNSLSGWLLFKEIEFLRFPKTYKLQEGQIKQDTQKIKSIIDAIGKFDLDENEEFLFLYCYK